MKRLLLLISCLSAALLNAQTLTVTPTTTNVSCFNGSNGTASIAISGCTGTPTYVWTPNVSTTSSATGLGPGSYTVDVTTAGTSGSDTLFFDNFEGTLKWSLNNNIGTQGGTPNLWVINSASPYSGSCSPNAGNSSMHITCGGGFACGLFAPNGEAAYNASGAASVTDRYTAVLNNISTVGRTNVQVKFTYVSNGQANTDYGNLRYSIDGGTNWTDLSTIYQSTSAWTCAVITLPVECENITNLKIGYRWRNNNTGGSDPPFNIDNVLVRADGGSGGPGCSGSTTFTITQPSSAVSVSVSNQTNVACFNGTTGSVTVAGSGGTIGAGYQYKIGNGALQNSGTFNGLAAGSYTITVQDANGCTSTVPVNITGPSAALTGSITNQTQTGCGTSTGSVTVAGTGGTSGYQYKIGNGPLQGSGTFSGLAAGSYTITIQDANNCTTTVPVTITSPSGLTLSNTNQTNVLCFGASTGSVTVAGANGTPNYQYKIGNGPLQGSGIFNGLAAGTYVITVQDGSNCTTTLNVTITGPSAALSVATSTQTNVACFNGTTGSVTVAGSGGTSGYQYKIGNGALQNSGTFNNLAAGTYTITVQDANGCTSTTSVTITGPSSALSVATSSQTNVACFNGTTGSVTVAGNGGTTGYQYKIGNGALQNSGTFNNLSAGTYIITVQDANSCTSTVSVTITGPSATLTGSITNQTQTGCGTSTGSVTVAGAGGTTGYQYKIGNGPLQGSGTFSGLAAGSYTITIQDANNCTTTVPVIITSPSGLTLSNTTQTNVLCFNGTTGSVTVAGANGTPSYQYKIGNGAYQPSGTFSGLAAGTYVITVQDGANCTTTLNVTITGPSAALSVATSTQTNVACFNGTTGSVTVAGSGGTTGYQYKIGNGTLQNSGTFNNLAAGTYTITVQDANGCTSTTSVTITGPSAALTGSISNQTPTSCGSNNGSVTVTASGGTTGYQYKIDNGPLQGTGVFNGLSAGPHTVTIQDANNCTTTVSVTIIAPSNLVASINDFNNVTCNAANDGSIEAQGMGGNPSYTFSLDGTSYQNSGSFTGLAPAAYVVYVKDNSGCIDTVHVTITEPAPVVVTTSPSGNVTLCEGDELVISVTSNGSTCSWSNGSLGSSITVTTGDTYSVTCTVNGCQGTSGDVVVTISPLPIASFNSTQINNYNVAFTSASINGSSYLWTFPGGTTSTEENPTFDFPGEGNFTVTLVVTNSCGSDTLSQIIGVDKLTGVNELGVLSSFNLYPNPANGSATIKLEAAKPVKGKLSVTTVDGRLVFADNISFNSAYTTTLDLSNLSGGIYIVNLVAEDIFINRKLIIEK